ncbi:MAG: PadR family transcriptional regulator [Saprospiraceae bacterium]
MKPSPYYKGSLSAIILHLLSIEERMYGYEITQRVKDMTVGEIIISEGALYPALHKLEDDGFLIAELEYVGTRVRKYYTLSEKGITAGKSKLEELEGFIKNIQLILSPPKLDL